MTNNKQKIKDIGEGFVDGYERGFNTGFLSALEGLKRSMNRNNTESVSLQSIIHYIQFHKSNPLKASKKQG